MSTTDTEVPLIEYNHKTSKFEVNKDGCDFLRTISGPIVSVSAIGPIRLGKSSMLNRAILGLDPSVDGVSCFTTSSKSKSCTTGLNLSKICKKIRTVDGQEANLLVIDSEGMGATTSFSQTYDLSIFALSMLCSDVCILNTQKTIREEDIEKMSITLDVAKKIKKKNIDKPTHSSEDNKQHSVEEAGEDSEIQTLSDIAEYFPGFIWLIRDASLDLVDVRGRPISATQYLEQSISEQDNVAPAKNRIRRAIKTCFPRRDCVLMGKPTNDDRKEKRVDEIPFMELNESYRRGCSELLNKVRTFAKPKQIKGMNLDGAAFAELVVKFVDAINSDDSSPLFLDDLHTSFSKQQIQREYEKFIPIFQKQIKQYKDRFSSRKKNGVQVMNPAELNEALESEIQSCLSQFRISVDVPDLVEEYVEKLRLQCQELIEPINEANLSNITVWLMEHIAKFDKFIHDSSKATATTVHTISQEFKFIYQKVVDKLGDSDAVQGMWWKDQDVANKIWDWVEYLFTAWTKTLRDQVERLKLEHEELAPLKKQYLDQQNELALKTQELEQVRAHIAELKQTAEVDFKQLKLRLSDVELKHEQEMELVGSQCRTAEARHDELHKQFLEAIQKHSEILSEKEQLICEQTALLNESKIRLNAMEQTVESYRNEINELQTEVSSIEIWRTEIHELKERNLQLQRENDEYKSKGRVSEEDFRVQFETMESEYVSVIEENKRHFDNVESQLKETIEQMKEDSKRIKSQFDQESRQQQESSRLLNTQIAKFVEDAKKNEILMSQMKLELSNLQKLFQEKQDEHVRNLLQLNQKIQTLSERESQLIQHNLQNELEWSRQLANKESETRIANTRYQDLERYWAQNEDVQSCKRLREENYSLNTKFVRAETELKSLKHEKKELETQLKDCRQQKEDLVQKLNQKESDHRVALTRAQLTGYRVTPSSDISLKSPKKK